MLTDAETGHSFVARNPEVFVYDADGNLVSDGRWTNTWDAENRLVAMESLPSVPDAAKRRLEFAYDNQSRRLQKTVYSWNGSSYVGQSTNRFVYDGWNLIATLNSDLSILQSYTWGLDLSGTLQDAGGVGGLLSIRQHSGANVSTYYYIFDANGNVHALLNAIDQNTVAQYEYGPFGEMIRITGPMAKVNPFQFSARFKDNETDLCYYGFRYYNLSTGRWLSTDPIAEKGGLNLFLFAGNTPLNIIDIVGLGYIYIERADGSKIIQVIPQQPKQPTTAEKLGDLILPNPKKTIEDADIAFGAAANPDLAGYERWSAGLAGTAIVILGVIEFVPGTGAETKPVKRECVKIALKLPQFSKSSIDDLIAEALKRGLKLTTHGAERLLERESGVTMKMIETTLKKGARYYDPRNKSYVFVLEKGLASGKDMAVALDAVSGDIRTIMTNIKVVRPRFQPTP